MHEAVSLREFQAPDPAILPAIGTSAAHRGAAAKVRLQARCFQPQHYRSGVSASRRSSPSLHRS